MSRILPSLQLLLAALLLPSILFLSSPLSVIRENSQEIAFHTGDLRHVAILFLLSFALLGAVLLLAKGRARALALRLVACLAINVILWNVASSYVWLQTYGQLALAVALEASLFVVIFLVLTFLPVPLVARTLAIFAVLNVAVTLYSDGPLALSLTEREADAPAHQAERTPPPVGPSDGTVAGNVYHVVLDAFSREYMNYRLAQPDDFSLPGYTYYRNAISNYGRTNLSMRSIFRGELFPPDFIHWAETAYENGMTEALAQNNVPMYFFPFYTYYCHPKFTVCNATQELYPHFRKNIGSAVLLDITFLNLLPVSAKDALMGSIGSEERPTDTWDYGFSLTSWWEALLRPGDGPPLWRRPIQSLTINTFAEFAEMEPRLSDHGRYVYLHMMVPHGPEVFDPDCRIEDPDIQAKKTVLQTLNDQYACALTIVERLNALLKDLDRFDDSLIIVHADHGLSGAWVCAEWNPNFRFDPQIPYVNMDEVESKTVPGQQIGCRAHALLAVKKPMQESFKVSDLPFQMIDIAPTILDYFGIEHRSYPGYSMLSDEPPPTREMVYFAAQTNELEDISHFAKFVSENGIWRYREQFPSVHAKSE